MPAGARIPGGHVTQLEKTAEALAVAGLDVRTSLEADPPDVDIDLVHGFGLDVGHIRYWHRRRVPVALSTVYWERAYRMGGAGLRGVSGRGMAGRVVRGLRFAWAAWQGNGPLTDASVRWADGEIKRASAYDAADLLLPNADGEGDAIRRDLGVTTPIVPVPNGVDPERFTPTDEPFAGRDTVLYVGRIEPHKNQLGLIEALRGSGFPLTIAGFEHPDHAAYVERCRRAGDGWVTFLTTRPGDGGGGLGVDDVAGLYRSARVHVLPSWFETTGLVSLEAALAGCNVVATTRGYAREYFEDLAYYCDPGRPGTIGEAVAAAWEAPPSPDLRARVLDRYTWRNVAEATIAAYRSLDLIGPAPARG